MSFPQDRYHPTPGPPPPPGAGQPQASTPWAPAQGDPAPAPPPSPPSNTTGTGVPYNPSYAGYPTYGQAGYNNPGYDNPYGGYYDQPSFDNPNSLYTNSGQVISQQSLPTPTYPDQSNPNPFLTPAGGSHPSLYNDNPTVASYHTGQSYSTPTPTNEFGVAANRPLSSLNPDRYNSPAPLPGQALSSASSATLVPTLSPPTGRRRVQLSDNPPSLVPGYPPSTTTVGSRHTRYGDEEAAGGEASEMALLGPNATGGRADRMSVGGFDPGVLDEEGNIRYGRIPQRVPRRYKTKKRYELFHGNLVIDNEVPSKLLDMCPLKNEREFKFMR